ncbi:MAG: hypothetical protein ACLRSW_03065 [Christensenellaceae bacterium]
MGGVGLLQQVRNMQKAAKLVVEKYGGDFPREEKALKALPGIGEYTAGAILSIAYGLLRARGGRHVFGCFPA